MDGSKIVLVRPAVKPRSPAFCNDQRIVRAIEMLDRLGRLDLIAYDEVHLALDTDRDRHLAGPWGTV